MKITRYKRVQRYLNFYKNNFSFRAPYQVLIDGTFCQAALKNKVNIKEQMPKYLNDQVKLMTTVCIVNETELIGPPLYGAMLIVKQFNVRKCGHEKNPIGASECLLSMIKNNNNQDHYIIATQDKKVINEVMKIPGCPILYMKMSAIVMSKPTQASEQHAMDAGTQQLAIPDHQMSVLKTLKKNILGESLESKKTRRKRKGPKGPNPLSCKKKKKKPNEETQTKNTDDKEKKRKKKKRNRKLNDRIKDLVAKIETSN